MKAKDAIKILQTLDPEETIILDYLVADNIHEAVQDQGYEPPTDQQIAAILERLTDGMHVDTQSVEDAVDDVMQEQEEEEP